MLFLLLKSVLQPDQSQLHKKVDYKLREALGEKSFHYSFRESANQ